MLSKKELKEMFNDLKIGDMFINIEIKGLKGGKDTENVLQELARRKSLKFEVTYSLYDGRVNVMYEVIQPSKKFLNRKGCWGMSVSKDAQTFLSSMVSKY